ncbi:MAG: helix-turn-helix domain-containing protein, partial [bacterium]
MKIGHKLKELRLQNGLTLEELASRSEVTKGFLSQLERDLTSPNLSTLEDILEALGTSLPAFFHDEPEKQVVFTKNDFFVDEQENWMIEWIVPNAQKNSMEPIILTINPGCYSQEITSHEGEEFGYVLKGSIVICAEKNYKVKAKETFYLNRAKTPQLYNPNASVAKVLWITM